MRVMKDPRPILTAPSGNPTYLPSGDMQASLRASDTACFRACLSRATHMSLALFGQRITSEPGAKARKHLSEAVATLAPVKVLALYAARRWLTTSRAASAILFAEVSDQVRNQVRDASEVFFSIGAWEDLALYRSDRILLCTETHEKEGMVYGDSAELRRWGLQPSPVQAVRLEAERIGDHHLGEILAAASR